MMELIQRNASRDEGYYGQAPRGSIGGWNPEGKSSIDLVAQFVGETAIRKSQAHNPARLSILLCCTEAVILLRPLRLTRFLHIPHPHLLQHRCPRRFLLLPRPFCRTGAQEPILSR